MLECEKTMPGYHDYTLTHLGRWSMMGSIALLQIFRACARARRFAVAAAAFSPFLKEALSSKRIWRGGLELGLWMGLGESFIHLALGTGDYCSVYISLKYGNVISYMSHSIPHCWHPVNAQSIQLWLSYLLYIHVHSTCMFNIATYMNADPHGGG